MKKQILTLTMCLALTATAALADGTKTVTTPAVTTTPAASTATTAVKTQCKKACKKACAKACTKSKSCAKKAVKKVMENTAAPTQPKVMTREEARRAMMYDKLGLSDAQRTKAEAIDAKTREGVSPLMTKLRTEVKKYKELKAKKANIFSLWKQKLAVNAAKKDVKNYISKSRAEFETILTPEQKVKFESLKKEMAARKAAARKNCHKRIGCPAPVQAPATTQSPASAAK